MITKPEFRVWPCLFLFFVSLLFLCYGIEHQNLMLSIVTGIMFFWATPILIAMFCVLVATPFPEDDDRRDSDDDDDDYSEDEPWHKDPDLWKQGIKGD